MLASLADAPLADPRLAYERKYDGIRIIAETDASGRARLWSRSGNEKTTQFPEIAAALGQWARRRKRRVVFDGEIVALDPAGQPAGFEQLQGRIHTTSGSAAQGPSAFVVFDLLREGTDVLISLPWQERRARLEQLFSKAAPAELRLSELAVGDGRDFFERARREGWEGLVVKDTRSRYRPAKRSQDWRKLKVRRQQEFVVAGWTEPRGVRRHLGALLLGVYHGGSPSASVARRLSYVGHTGTGFSDSELERVMARLAPLETSVCPFDPVPRTNERPHWVTPLVLAEVQFAEWTSDGLLRHPVYHGLRDDKPPRDVRREETAPLPQAARRQTVKPPASGRSINETSSALIAQIDALESSKKGGVLLLPGGRRLAVTNLGKVFWPGLGITKGELFRHYIRVAPYLLPVLADRPLVMKRYPNGIEGEPFYQHRTLQVPEGVRLERVEYPDPKPQLVGGDLLTLLYTTQLAAISQDPWFSRVGTADHADFAAIDLDPMPDVEFSTVIDVARWIHDELERLGAAAFAKTSGADGLHIFIPLRPGTSYGTGLLFCQIVATLVADKHPKVATVERSVRLRGRRVYIDYLQNIMGKTLASAYSARASAYAGVSTPLTWQEVHDGVRREDFTVASLPARLEQVGDLWAGLRRAKGVDLERAIRRLESRV
jgi:bifunctional non-homologous end joining protein LigD